ncbi:MAG: hypothetical protein ACRCUJ_06170 [Phocaeicola sp.]
MKNKKNFPAATTIALVAILLLLVTLAYLMTPSSDTFAWSSLNPLTPLAGVLFLLSFGAGIPLWVAALILLALLFLLFKAIQKLIKRL